VLNGQLVEELPDDVGERRAMIMERVAAAKAAAKVRRC